MRFPQNAG